MTLRGSIHKRVDGLIDSRIKARNGSTIGTSGGQGFKRTRPARVTLEHLLCTGPHIVRDIDGNIIDPTAEQLKAYQPPKLLSFLKGRPTALYTGQVYERKDGKFEWRIKSRNGKTVFTSHSQGFERAGRVNAQGVPTKGTALASLVLVCHGGPHEAEAEILFTD